ncbi:MAG: hypothetical protein WC962_08195, partial [Phycisphaerae bacterium]
ILDSPSVLESIKKNTGSAQSGAESPLVQQAKKFALYLDPPPPPRPATPPPTRRTSSRPEPKVSAKFELLGTSYYAERPELSLALIDEPGVGLRWIRQSNKIGNFTIEEVQDGKVIINDGQSTYELEPKLVPKRSLLKGESSSFITSLNSASEFDVPEPSVSRAARNTSRRTVRQSRSLPSRPETSSNPSDYVQSEQDRIQAELLEKFAQETEQIDDPNEWMEKADELMKQLENSSEVSDGEAQMLDMLGEELDDANQQEDEQMDEESEEEQED